MRRQPDRLDPDGSSLGLNPGALAMAQVLCGVILKPRHYACTCMRVPDWGSHFSKDLDMVQAQLVQHGTCLLQWVNRIVIDTSAEMPCT